MSEFEKIRGTWVHSLPWDTDDYLAEYSISGDETTPVVKAVDLGDGEEFEITDVKWENGKLTFKSFMPSTQREGKNEFSLTKDGIINSRFTFTVFEQLQRKNT